MILKLIVDTDCGTDDLLALAYLIAHPAIEIEAIVTVRGLASARQGAINLTKVLTRLGIENIPIHVGSEAPLGEFRQFPSSWVTQTESLDTLQLPVPTLEISTISAREFYRGRLVEQSGATILALGPLTNLARVLEDNNVSANASNLNFICMGGAIDAPGNLGGGGEFRTENRYAEWNFFIDPLAVSKVFASNASILLVPLDATNQVPIRPSLLAGLRSTTPSPAAKISLEILDGVSNWISEGHYFAWDPLAAVLVSEPVPAFQSLLCLRIELDGIFSGRLVRDVNGREVSAYLHADLRNFERAFCSVLGV